MRWRIYYGDGSTYGDRDGSPYDAPRVNVQVITFEVLTLQKGFGLTHGKDAYFWRDDLGWQGCDMAGLWDYLMNHRGPQSVLFGRTLRDDQFWSVVGRAGREGLG